IPIASRPTALNGWYQYAGIGSDSGEAAITLFKNGTVIGSGAVYFTGTVSNWTSFSVPVTYTSSDVPDTVQLLFFSSTGDSTTPNSTLWLDDLSYDYASAINQTQAIKQLQVFPNPANNIAEITYSLNQSAPVSLELYDLAGRKVQSAINNQVQTPGRYRAMLNTENLEPGIYFYTLTANGITQTKRLEIVH
ncbi:MAG TPA: T9SS type A sorting domain-containing protein, partial [Chitinophagales bacterium]|nr:T9SS type A sorting domain-containing protein [Chitinophagales bacterium]